MHTTACSDAQEGSSEDGTNYELNCHIVSHHPLTLEEKFEVLFFPPFSSSTKQTEHSQYRVNYKYL